MTILKEVYAGDTSQAIIHAMRIDIGNESIYVCDGFGDLVLSGILHEAGNITVSLPRRAKSGAQKLNFGVWNAYGRALDYLDMALENDSTSYVTYYQYLEDDLDNYIMITKPMNITSARFTNNTAVFEAAYHDILNTKFPRATYNNKTSPAIQYS